VYDTVQHCTYNKLTDREKKERGFIMTTPDPNNIQPSEPQAEQQAPQPSPQQPQFAAAQPQFAAAQPQPQSQPQYAAPQQQYAPQYPQYGAPQAQRSGLAIAGFVLGLLSIFFCWTFIFDLVPALAGIGLSISGLVATGKGKAKTGHGFAIAGLILAIIGLILAIILTVALFTAAAKNGGSYSYNYSWNA
jgi:hypothetical protein